MYNKGIIIPGLVIFTLFITFPIWFNAFYTVSAVPNPQPPPGGEKSCVLTAAEMRSGHMVLLNDWRDSVLRDGSRTALTIDGKEYRRGLQMSCMACHSNKEQFCDSCHQYVSVKPYCWDCHISPSLAAAKRETY